MPNILYNWAYDNNGGLLIYGEGDPIVTGNLQFYDEGQLLNPVTVEMLKYYVNLLIIQYKNQPKANATIMALVESGIANTIIQTIGDAFNVDTAVGVQLDWIGKYVGMDRFYNFVSYPLAFGFTDEQNQQFPGEVIGFTTAADFLTEDGTFLGAEEVVTNQYKLNDDDYRVLIKLKIIQNHSNFSMKEIDDSLFDFFGEDLYVIDNYDMTMTYYFNKQSIRSVIINAAINKGVIPKPMGVKLTTPIEI